MLTLIWFYSVLELGAQKVIGISVDMLRRKCILPHSKLDELRGICVRFTEKRAFEKPSLSVNTLQH